MRLNGSLTEEVLTDLDKVRLVAARTESPRPCMAVNYRKT